MLFAAGRGTRLGALTETTPKALLEVGGAPVIRHVAERLIAAGADRLIVNTHHHADAVARYLLEEAHLGVDIRISPEPTLLETGGGLRAAAHHFRGDAPFFIHNADVLSDIPLTAVREAHARSGALATVVVMERESSRGLLFDELGLLGRIDRDAGLELRVREPRGAVRLFAFAGIHVASPALLGRITEPGAVSIRDVYVRLAGEGERIAAFDATGMPWVDIGRPAELKRARALFGAGSAARAGGSRPA